VAALARRRARLHTLSLGLRWSTLGHGPFTTMHEILSSNLWSLALVLACLVGAARAARALLLAMPVLAGRAGRGWLLMADAAARPPAAHLRHAAAVPAHAGRQALPGPAAGGGGARPRAWLRRTAWGAARCAGLPTTAASTRWHTALLRYAWCSTR
jgi:hypothetical protein